MVCLGNICRSPMAQMVTQQIAAQAGLGRVIQVESAGTHASGYGEPPDPRAQKVLSAKGYSVGKIRSRRVVENDFVDFDLILAMDRSNLENLRRICPFEQSHKLRLFLDFSPTMGGTEVPDPYYGSIKGFENVLALCEIGGKGLIDHFKTATP